MSKYLTFKVGNRFYASNEYGGECEYEIVHFKSGDSLTTHDKDCLRTVLRQEPNVTIELLNRTLNEPVFVKSKWFKERTIRTIV